jgi:uncharacterized protein (TIGR02246 family)
LGHRWPGSGQEGAAVAWRATGSRRRWWLAASFLLTLAGAPAQDLEVTPMSMRVSAGSKPGCADEAAIRRLYDQLLAGWNAGDGAAFAAPFASNGDLVGFDGTHLKGRAAIGAFHQQLFDTYAKGSRMVGTVRSVRFLTPEVAVMHAASGTVMAGEADLAPDRNSVQTLVAVQGNEGWRLAAFQNTRAEFLGRPEMARALTEELQELLGARA